MLARHSRRQRQHDRVAGELRPLLEADDDELLEVSDEALEARCWGWRGSGDGRWAASVCSCSRREASAEPDMNDGGTGL